MIYYAQSLSIPGSIDERRSWTLEMKNKKQKKGKFRMKKSELNLSALPDKYEADVKFSKARYDKDFTIALYAWTDEEEKEKDFCCYDDSAAEIDSIASLDDCLNLCWCKAETETVTDILKNLADDMNCLFEFTRWHDGSRQETYVLKPVAYNDKWICFEPDDPQSNSQF